MIIVHVTFNIFLTFESFITAITFEGLKGWHVMNVRGALPGLCSDESDGNLRRRDLFKISKSSVCQMDKYKRNLTNILSNLEKYIHMSNQLEI